MVETLMHRLKKWYPLLLLMSGGVLLALALIFMIPYFFADINDLIRVTEGGTTYHEKPNFVGYIDLADKTGKLIPYSAAEWNGYLYIGYINNNYVSIYDQTFEEVKRIYIPKSSHSSVSGIDVDENYIYLIDSNQQKISFYSHEGNLVHTFGYYPNLQDRLKPFSLNVNQGVLYVSDQTVPGLLAISAREVEQVTSIGELIVKVNNQSLQQKIFSDPSGVHVTPDGRVFLAERGNGGIHVLSCSGFYLGMFENEGPAKSFGPVALEMDDMPPPPMSDEGMVTFDPTGVSEQGRVHVVDKQIARVKVYDTYGSYLFTYGKELNDPVDISIDENRKLILILDAQSNSIAVYKY